jgi:hypothetical protein
MLPINRNPGVRQVRAFSRIWFPLFVVALGAMAWWRWESPTAAIAIWVIGSALVALVLASAEAARIAFVALITISYPLGLVISTIALGFMFYVVFTPLGVLMRFAGRDPLRLRQRGAASHWTPYRQIDDPEQAFRQY